MSNSLEHVASASRFAIAAAIVYFGYQLAQIGGQVGSVTDSVEQVSAHVPATLEEVKQIRLEIGEIRQRIPEVLAEVEAVRKLVPPILDEVAATRAQIPPVLDEIAKTRAQIPPLLQRVDAINRQIDPILAQVEATTAVVDDTQKQIPAIVSTANRGIDSLDSTREEVVTLVPQVLDEVRLTRDKIDPTLDRVDGMVEDAYAKAQTAIATAGQQASEGAVKGFFTGIIKLPFNLVGTLASPITKNIKPDVAKQLTEKDLELMTEAGAKVVAAGEVDREGRWENPNSGNSGSVTVSRFFQIDNLECIEARIRINNRRKNILDKLNEFCRTEGGEWTLASEIRG